MVLLVAFARTLKDMIRLNKPDILTLQEPRISGSRALQVIRSLGFQFHLIVEARGFSGGIWILWNNNSISITQIQAHDQFLHVKVEAASTGTWLLSVIYASPRASERAELWEAILNLSSTISSDWLVVRDFNEIACPSEKKGGGAVDYARCELFTSWINECNLLDLGFVGSKFTWRGPQWQGLDRVFKRLDRALCNASWITRFEEAIVLILTNSDHHPLLIKMHGDPIRRVNKSFKFEASWLKHGKFLEMVGSVWEVGGSFLLNLQKLSNTLPSWNRNVFGDIYYKKRILLARLNGIQGAYMNRSNPFLEELEGKHQKGYQELLAQEELMWFQKSRAEWIKDGDRNTRYYHTKTIIRRRRNKVFALRNEAGEWTDDIEQLFKIMLFRSTKVCLQKRMLSEIFPNQEVPSQKFAQIIFLCCLLQSNKMKSKK